MARRPRLLSPTVLLRRNALYKGVFGGSRGWMAVGAALWGPRLAKRLLGRSEEVVAVEKLKPGQFLRIEALRPPTRRERKSARRAS
jgi:hypothetical protein